jgi:hypothetical protein
MRTDIEYDDDIVADGESVRVPMMVMDAMAGHRQGYVEMTDEQIAMRARARSRWIAEMCDAWRGPLDARRRRKRRDDDDEPMRPMGSSGQGRTDPDKIGQSALDARRVANSAYSEMCRKLQDSWRSPPSRDAHEPDASERLLGRAPAPHDDPMAAMRRHLGDPDDDNPQARRDAAWNAYKDRLSRAYLQGRADPTAAATRIEKERERYLGKFER